MIEVEFEVFHDHPLLHVNRVSTQPSVPKKTLTSI